MPALRRRPRTHRKMPRERGQLGLLERKPRRAMRQPADVHAGLAHQAARLAYQSPVHRPAGRMYEGKHQAFGNVRRKIGETLAAQQVAHKKTQGRAGVPGPPAGYACGPGDAPMARRKKPIPAQRVATLGDGAVATQIRLGQRPDPINRDGKGRRRLTPQP